MERKVSREWNFQGILCTGGICRNSYTKFCFMSCFLFSVAILCAEWLRVIVRGKFSPGSNCLEDISVGSGFLREGGPDFLALFKNDQKYKKSFQLKVRSNIKT
jgi:hypothetical protein